MTFPEQLKSDMAAVRALKPYAGKPWSRIQVGESYCGQVVIARRVRRKRDALDIVAAHVGSRLWIDGRRTWAVMRAAALGGVA